MFSKTDLSSILLRSGRSGRFFLTIFKIARANKRRVGGKHPETTGMAVPLLVDSQELLLFAIETERRSHMARLER